MKYTKKHKNYFDVMTLEEFVRDYNIHCEDNIDTILTGIRSEFGKNKNEVRNDYDDIAYDDGGYPIFKYYTTWIKYTQEYKSKIVVEAMRRYKPWESIPNAILRFI